MAFIFVLSLSKLPNENEKGEDVGDLEGLIWDNVSFKKRSFAEIKYMFLVVSKAKTFSLDMFPLLKLASWDFEIGLLGSK